MALTWPSYHLQVTDLNGNPLVGAIIDLIDSNDETTVLQSQTTDSGGNVVFTNFTTQGSSGRVSPSIRAGSAPGYQPGIITLDRKVFVDEVLKVAKVVGDVDFYLTNSNGCKVGGVTIAVSPGGSPSGTTDSLGHVKLTNIPIGVTTFAFTSNGYPNDFATVEVTAQGAVTHINIGHPL